MNGPAHNHGAWSGHAVWCHSDTVCAFPLRDACFEHRHTYIPRDACFPAHIVVSITKDPCIPLVIYLSYRNLANQYNLLSQLEE